MELNDKIHGFILKKVDEIEEVNGVARTFEHEKTGARLIYISNEDNNKVFQIAFRTPSENSTGVAHILEHSVLCGSRKYPVKEPFVELAKGSMNTFLNAMTYPDKTVYPIASTNAKDFMNLMDVYLDAVFYPEIYNTPYIFHQEGWHYHIEDKQAPITYNGVVYNEMKGVFSSPEEVLQKEIFAALYPDTIYGGESGGDPDCIPNLSYEDFVGFHKKFYHPSNAYIYMYGDGDVVAHLQYLDEQYLANFEKDVVDSSIATQKPFESMAEVSVPYALAKEESTENKAYLSLNYVLEDEPTFEDMLAFEILGHILLGANSSPLKKALLDLNICKEVDYSYSSSMKQPCFSIVLKHTEIEHKDLFIKTVEETLLRLVKEGLYKRSLLAGININEFTLVEGEFGTYPKGLMYGLEMLDTWLYGGDPLTHLKYRGVIKSLRESSENKGFEGIIARYLLGNTHRALVSIYPDVTLSEKREKEISDKLAAYKASLNDAELTQLVEATQALLKRQNTEDSPESLATIPKLCLSEIDKKARKIVLEKETFDGLPLLYHPGKTCGIAYVKFYFDTHVVPQEDLKYLSLLNKLMGRLSTEDFDDEHLNQEIEIHTGGISSALETLDSTTALNEYASKLVVKGKVMVDKMAHLITLIESTTLRNIFDEKHLIADIVSEIRMNKENQFLMGGHTVTVQRLQSYYSQAARMFEELAGIEFYRFIADLDDHFDERFEALSGRLKAVSEAVFNRQNLILSITCDPERKSEVLQGIKPYLEHLPSKDRPVYTYQFDLEAKNEGFMSAAKIQYVSKGYNLKELGYDYHGSMLVLKTILSMDYLWNRVRVQGGAYGVFFGVNRAGELYFASYRDPNLVKTLEAYDEAFEYIENLDISQRELEKYIIGTISSKDVPLSDAIRADGADTMYFNSTKPEDLQKERDEILGTTVENLRAMSRIVKDVMHQGILCAIGSEDTVKSAEKWFKDVTYIK